jgi:hypothetical protein
MDYCVKVNSKTNDKNDFLEKRFEKYFKLNIKSIIYDKLGWE